MDENYTDVLRTSLLNPSSYLSLPSVKKSPQQLQTKTHGYGLVRTGWIESSTRRDSGDKNCRFSFTWRRYRRYDTDSTPFDVTLPDNKVLGGHRHGRVIWVDRQPLAPYWTLLLNTTVRNKELTAMTTRCSEALRMDLEQEQQTSVVQLSGERRQNTTTLPPLPVMPEPEAYVTQPDVMTPQMRRNYVRDRTQAALTYIKEYEASQEWEHNPQYDVQQVRQRLQILYGKADQVKQRIDTALLNDDIYRRRRVMRTLELPERFPLPQNMKNNPVATWVQWIRDESNKLITAIDEEILRHQDPDDPFDGTASGIFPPLQNIDELQQGTTPKAQSNQVKVDESTNCSPWIGGTLTGKLVDVQSPPPRQVNSSQQNQRRMTSLSQEQQQVQVPASDSSQNRTDAHGEQGEMRATTSQSTALTSRQ